MNKINLKRKYYSEIHSIMRENEDYNMEIQEILYREVQGKEPEIKAIAYNKDCPDEAVCIKINMEGYEQYSSVPEWDYNIDTYLFQDLADGFKILYMPIETHQGIWPQIDDFRYEIDCIEGFQKYLGYCKEENINVELLSRYPPFHIKDIMDMYNEVNIGYKIISEMSCGENTIVLGCKKDNDLKYVTWSTTPERKFGYNLGHYFTDFKSAFKDYKARCFNMMEKQLLIQKQKCKPRINKSHER